MAINFTVPNQIIVLGGYSGVAWLATYSSEGNLLAYLKNIPILQPHAIKIVQSPTSNSFYITAE